MNKIDLVSTFTEMPATSLSLIKPLFESKSAKNQRPKFLFLLLSIFHKSFYATLEYFPVEKSRRHDNLLDRLQGSTEAIATQINKLNDHLASQKKPQKTLRQRLPTRTCSRQQFLTFRNREAPKPNALKIEESIVLSYQLLTRTQSFQNKNVSSSQNHINCDSVLYGM